MPPLEIVAYTLIGVALLILVGAIAIFMTDPQIDELLRKDPPPLQDSGGLPVIPQPRPERRR